MTQRKTIAQAPSGEDTSFDGTEKFPVSGNKYGLISTILEYIRTATATLTNKTINLTSNTLTGTTAQFNTANSDGDFATLAGSETLTNKTLTSPTIGSFTNATHNHEAAAGGGTLDEDALALTDVTTNNSSTTKHGFLKKLDNDPAHFMDGQGNWTAPSVAASVATDAIWDAKGDLAGGTGANTAARLAVGANGLFLQADSAEATGLKWATPAGTSLTNSNISPTTADVTAAVNTRYFANISGLTADRNFKLPAGTVGDIIELNIKTGDDTYEFIVIGDTGISINGGSAATEWSRLFITNENVRLIADTTSNWQVVHDGRIPCKGVLTLSAAETTNSAATDTTPTWDNKVIDVGNMGDTTNFRFNVRRAGYYRVNGSYLENSAITDQKYLAALIYQNATSVSEVITRAANTSANYSIPLPPKTVLCAVDDTLTFKYNTEEANRGMLNSAPRSFFQAEEIF